MYKFLKLVGITTSVIVLLRCFLNSSFTSVYFGHTHTQNVQL